MTDHDDCEDSTPRDSERKGEVAQQWAALDSRHVMLSFFWPGLPFDVSVLHGGMICHDAYRAIRWSTLISSRSRHSYIRPIHPSAWNRNSTNFAFWDFAEVRSIEEGWDSSLLAPALCFNSALLLLLFESSQVPDEHPHAYRENNAEDNRYPERFDYCGYSVEYLENHHGHNSQHKQRQKGEQGPGQCVTQRPPAPQPDGRQDISRQDPGHVQHMDDVGRCLAIYNALRHLSGKQGRDVLAQPHQVEQDGHRP